MSNEFRRAQDCVLRARLTVIAILMMLPVAFEIGRVTGPHIMKVRDVEAAPVPNELPVDVSRFRDPAVGATCWRIDGGGLACVPDQWLLFARQDDAR